MLAVVGMYALSLTRLAGVAGVALTTGLAFLWIGAEGVVGARGTMRRAKLSPSIAGISIGLLMIVGNGARLAGSPPGVAFLFAYDAVLAATALGLVADLLAGRWSEGIVTRVVVDLGDAAQAGTVRDRLARALGDPTLVLGYGVDGRAGSFVDEAGQPIPIPSSEAGRVVTPMIVSGRETGFIAHDAAVLDDPRLVATISAATELAMSNASMQAQVRARVAEVDASRERLVHAADSQRRRLERLLQAGAARRLGRVAELLTRIEATGDPARSSLASLRDDLAGAQAELADFARGVHPAVLTTAGLATALADLVQRTPLHVELTIDARRADPLTESTLYFVCSEGLANAAKHAGAERIAIDLRDDRRRSPSDHLGRWVRRRPADFGRWTPWARRPGRGARRPLRGREPARERLANPGRAAATSSPRHDRRPAFARYSNDRRRRPMTSAVDRHAARSKASGLAARTALLLVAALAVSVGLIAVVHGVARAGVLARKRFRPGDGPDACCGLGTDRGGCRACSPGAPPPLWGHSLSPLGLHG